MRQKINENPVYQAAVIGLLLVAFAVVFMTQVAGGGSDEEASSDASAPAAPAPADATAATPVAPETVVPDAAAGGAAVAPAPAPGEFEAGPGLPRDVVRAHEDGKTVVLLIRRSKGIDDREMVRAVNRLDDPGVAVFTSRVRSVERYSRITIGVDVNRAPALIVVRPKRFDVNGQPQANVTYGLRSQQATEQQVRDAVYDGREDVPYHPG
ncbi:hypothetical protein HJD18_08820 [Thermoleophilia bacterium SCSIO 60948]|nr:hypothetical protein HJD18_08820 [Thermoleophilia bacterium SCSIO 60948]